MYLPNIPCPECFEMDQAVFETAIRQAGEANRRIGLEAADVFTRTTIRRNENATALQC